MEYYDRLGNPITMDAWVMAFEDTEGRRVATDELVVGGEDVRISTVWLGANHQYGDGPPLIFETMVFGGEHDGDQWRYSTEEEARAGHQSAVASVKS